MASISDRVGDVGGYLREQREHAKLSVRQLASLAGVSNPYLSQVERGLRHPSAEVLQQIAKGLRISAEALYIRAGILDHENRPDVEAAVGADPHLNDRQRRVLLDIYASFRSENDRAHSDQAIAPGEVVMAAVKAVKPATSGVDETAAPATPVVKRPGVKKPARSHTAPPATGTKKSTPPTIDVTALDAQ